MEQIEALQKELAELREENKQLIFWQGFAQLSIKNLVALAESSGHEKNSDVRTAKRFLTNEEMKKRVAA